MKSRYRMAAPDMTPTNCAATYNENQRFGRRRSVSKNVRSIRVTDQSVRPAIVQAMTVASAATSAPTSRETSAAI